MGTISAVLLGMVACGTKDPSAAKIGEIAAKAGVELKPSPHLKGTAVLSMPKAVARPAAMTWPKQGSIFAVQLEEANTYFQKQIAATPAMRDRAWRPDFSSREAYASSVERHRQDLRRMLGLIDLRVEAPRVDTLAAGPLRVEDVSLKLAEGFKGRGLVFVPPGKVSGAVVAIPDAHESREQFAGIAAGSEPAGWLKTLLGRGLAVAVPITVERTMDYPYGEQNRVDRRLLLYRLGFIVGRTLVGMEVQQAEGFASYLEKRLRLGPQQLALLGLRQGGMTALYAGAAGGPWGAVSVVNYFEQREQCWQEPADRMLYGQLKEFGDAEVAALIAPHLLDVIYTPAGPTPAASVKAEAKRARRFYQGLDESGQLRVETASTEAAALDKAAELVAATLTRKGPLAAVRLDGRVSEQASIRNRNHHFEVWHEYLKQQDVASDATRQARWKLLETPPSERKAKAAALRKDLKDLMGTVPVPNMPLDPRTRLILVTDKFVAYQVLLDAVPGVHAFGQLLVPRGAEERRPVVICQHGLGGRPADITGIGANPDSIYHSLGAHLADLGYVVFAPYVNVPIRQEILVNPLVREAAALGMMRTSLELAKLHRIIDFLDTQPYVDPSRIAYYGLSYGGYSAIWMPPLEPRIKASVVSGHFNDWRAKITDENYNGSYLRYQDADFYNWEVLNRLTHMELIAAMYPRPVCVEFGQQDPTTTPAWHARAWAQVTAWKRAWGLGGLDERVTRVHFEGPHEIHGVGTLSFLNRWLRPEMPDQRDHTYNLIPTNIQLSIVDSRGGLNTGQNSTVPLAQHKVDADLQTRIEGRFYVSSKYPNFTGMAFQLSRVDYPGDLIIRFGTTPEGNNLGEVRIDADKVDPMFDLWYDAKVNPKRLDPSKLYYFEITARPGRASRDGYMFYGPQPLGGTDEPENFGLSYQVLAQNEPPALTHHYERFGFMRPVLSPYNGGPAVLTAGAPNQKPGEIKIDSRWTINSGTHRDEVTDAAASDLGAFFKEALGIPVKLTETQGQPQIRLRVMPSVPGVHTVEGFQVARSPNLVTIDGTTPRGVMRGVYAFENNLRERHGAFIKPGTQTRNMRFSPRITTAVHEGGLHFNETSTPMVYTDGLLQRISHSGFNAIWVWLNTEEATLNSKTYPELNDPDAATRLARLEDVTRRARRYGIDVYIYLGTGYNHHIAPAFFKKHPDARGYGWGPPLCTSNPTVRAYYTEVIHTIFHRAPDLKGIIVIYDSEGFWYCGNSERNLKQCPRCSHFTQQQVAAQLLTTLDKAMHEAGGPGKQFIAWNYNVASEWVVKLFPLLPKDIIIQADFDKGMVAEKDGVKNVTEDYNISNIGPPDLFISEYKAVKAAGLKMMAKTEHAVSQEFILVPYIPCMGQWYRRIAKMREYDLIGWFGNWDHYGYTPSLPADLINRMSFDPAPTEDELLDELAVKKFGPEAAPSIIKAWHDFSQGIREFPYSDPVARVPGPIQKGPSQPLFLSPKVKGFGPWRSWQNNLNWTKPWGPAIATRHLQRLEELYAKGDGELAAAKQRARDAYRPAIAGEWRVGETIQHATQSVLHLADWIEARDSFMGAQSNADRQQRAEKLEAIALDERANSEATLPLLRKDSRLGYAAIASGGLFTPALVEWKIGFIDDVLLRQLPEALRNGNKDQ